MAISEFPSIERDIARAWTLPAALYTEGSVFAREKEKIFSRSWQVVGHCSQVVNTGDYFTAELIGEPLLLVRGSDGLLRGFYNVCRHRAGPLTDEEWLLMKQHPVIGERILRVLPGMGAVARIVRHEHDGCLAFAVQSANQIVKLLLPFHVNPCRRLIQQQQLRFRLHRQG